MPCATRASTWRAARRPDWISSDDVSFDGHLDASDLMEIEVVAPQDIAGGSSVAVQFPFPFLLLSTCRLGVCAAC